MVFLVGVGLGAAFSAPVGPVALSLVGISSLRGTRDQLRALIGTCLGHALLASAALAVLGSGGTSGGAGGLLGLVVALAFCVLGLLLIVRAPQAIGLVDRVQRPFTALFVLSVANPMAALSWLGLLHAASSRHHGSALLVFAAGALIGTALWHTGLVIGGATIPERHLVGATRVGGVVLVGVGLGGVFG